MPKTIKLSWFIVKILSILTSGSSIFYLNSYYNPKKEKKRTGIILERKKEKKEDRHNP